MKEYIERETAINAIENDCLELVYYTKEDAIQCVKAIPAADVAPVRRGRWTIAEDDYYGLNIVKCSVCHEEWCFEERDDVFDLNYHYCPNCGAYMMGENNGKCE